MSRKTPAKRSQPETLCWACRNAHGLGCDWFQFSDPVPGWEAERLMLKDGNGGQDVDSYRVISCPEYVEGKAGRGKEEA